MPATANVIALVRSAGRALLRTPAFALTATLTLAVGVGLSIAVFTVADALVLRALPVHEQDRLVTVWSEKRDGTQAHWPLGIEDVRAFTQRTRTLSDVAYTDYYGATPVPVLVGDEVAPLRRALVSGNYFEVLGARAAFGRSLQASDDVLGAAPVVVLSHTAWRRQFGSDPTVLGRRITVQLDGISHTVVGVMPAGLEYPAGTDVWGPYTPTRLRNAADTSYAAVDLVGRLADGATTASAAADLNAYLARPESSAWSRELRAVVTPLERVLLGDTRVAVIAFTSAAALLLLITCIDVANLLLVRGLSRMREIAVRTALGATRWQVMVQLLTENAILAFAGGVIGLGVAFAAMRGFLAIAPAELPLVERIHLDASALAAALATCGIALMIFGLAPAIISARGDAHTVLRSGTRQSQGRMVRIAREALVAAQVGLAVLVLSGAALIGRSLMKLENATLGFDSSRLLIADLGLRYDRYGSLERQLTVLRTVLERARATPGVAAATPVVAVPFSGTSGWTGRAAADGQSPEEASRNPTFNMELVTPDYFPTFGLRVLRGRALTDADGRGSAPVVVISERTARAYWPNQEPLGKRLRMGERFATVVGVVPDTRYRELREALPSVYFPLAQSVFPFPPTTLAVRAAGPPAGLLASIRRAVEDAAPGVVVSRIAAFDDYLRGPLAQPRLNAYLLGLFALAAASLAAVGLFGVMAMMVRQRVPELGIRMALGASSTSVLLMILRRGMGIASSGIALGLVGALLVNRMLSSLLYGVTPTDPAVLAAVTLFLLAITLVGTTLPARAGSRVDPAIALRLE